MRVFDERALELEHFSTITNGEIGEGHAEYVMSVSLK